MAKRFRSAARDWDWSQGQNRRMTPVTPGIAIRTLATHGWLGFGGVGRGFFGSAEYGPYRPI